jgi:cysteinyl-tRNA synthetase
MLRLYNTLTRQKEEPQALTPGRVGIYSCGPTVYRDVHIGNLRTYLMADWLRRALEGRGLQVTHVKNITDVGHMRQELVERGEDKVIAAALAAGRPAQVVADEYTESFMRDEAALNIRPAHVFPKATEHIAQMIAMTERLRERGLAYEVDGNVYFDVERFDGYGKLSGNTGESLLQGVRADADPRKRDPRDFALWKAAEPGRTMKWPSPWGDGFPGWHIECSAMSTHHLGERFDIHTGGVDNVFPHHEDEVAQSEGALGHQVVQHWVHGQHLLVDGLKMSKSTGNSYTLSDLTTRGFDPLAFRYLCATAHYRHRLNFTFESLRAAALGLNRLRQAAFLAAEDAASTGSDADREHWELAFFEALDDDLHLPRALAVVWELVRRSDAAPGLKLRLLRRFDEVLGLDIAPEHAEAPAVVYELIDERQQMRERGWYEEADKLRDRIGADGFEVRDAPGEPVLVPKLMPPPERVLALHSSSDVPSRIDGADELEFSLIVIARDDLPSLERATAAALKHASGHEVELIVIDNASSDGTGEWLSELADADGRVQPVFCDHNLGTAAARNVGLRLARGRYVVLLDTSIEVAGDALTPLARTLEEDGVGVVGAVGVTTEDLRDFEDAPGPDVDAVEGYLMAFRRSLLREVGLMDEKFRFYRHLDLDYSFTFRELGYHNRIVTGLPLRRHAHSDWERTPPEERDRLSKRNFYRFLKKHGHRQDLLLAQSR